LTLTPGQTADVTEAKSLILGFPLEEVIGDKGYDSKQIVADVEAQGGRAVIPSRKNAITPREIDRDRYKDRNLVERYWSKIKQYRRVATRYEKKAQNFLAFVHIASIMILLR
jgi:transposase